MSRKASFEQLAKQRVRVARVTVIVLLILLLVLAAVRVVLNQKPSLQPLDYFIESISGSPIVGTTAPIDPLGIASQELEFVRSSDDASIIWYSSMSGKVLSALLVDRALKAQGWISCVDEEQVLNSYLRFSGAAGMPEYATVLFYEYETGCSIIVEVLR